MTAIFAAFNRHQIACAHPRRGQLGLRGRSDRRPHRDRPGLRPLRALSWTAVANATSYAVYRTEGVAGCEFGKVKLAETADLSYFDDGLQNGRTYFYSVLPLGTSDACFGTMSVCASVVPAAGSNLGVVSVHPAVSGGDGDPFLDNCELATATIDVANTGSVTQTNVRIVAIEPVTHPSTIIVSSLPIAVSPSLAECDTAQAAFQLRAQGLAFDETSEVRVTLASDQLDALGQTRTVTLRFENVESDFEAVATQTYGFETNLENWKVISGTFARSTAGGGAGGTTAHVTSSQNADFACDVIRSPLIRVGAGVSTLTMQVRYAIEPTSDQVYDRANVSLYDAATGASTVISPSAGQAYTGGASFPFGCVLDHENGWNGTNPGNPAFVASTWSTGALSPGGTFDNKIVRLEIAYGTDEVISLAGFDFDQVALTNVEIQVPDTQSDVCLPPGNILPEALHVDAAGNGVLDAGESAVIAPSWKNPDVAGAAVTGSLSNFHGPGGPDLHDRGRYRRLRDHRGRGFRVLHGLLLGIDRRGDAARGALGRDGVRGRHRRRGPEDLEPARRRQLHRRHARRLLSLYREHLSQRRHRRLRRRPLLPGLRRHPRADGGLSAHRQGRHRLHSAPVRHAGVRRCALLQPIREMDQRARRARSDRRLRRRALLPDQPDHP